MPVTLYCPGVLTPAAVDSDTIVLSDEGKIAYVGSMEDAPRAEGARLYERGRMVASGFIDVHTHGGHGITFGEGETVAHDLQEYSSWVISTGVTGFLCTVAAPDVDSLIQLVAEYVELFENRLWPGARPLGLHVEGPFLSDEKRGAFSPEWLRAPGWEAAQSILEAGQGWIRQMTLAPELPGATEVAALVRSRGAVVAMGHSNADYETASAALRGDFTHVTHTFNAQRGFHHREPGVLGAVMSSDRVTAELIADTVHVHPAAMKILLRCLGPGRVVLVTDAMAGAGLPDGVYDLMDGKVTVMDGKATLADGTIAGSVATMDTCVRNLHREVGVSLADAVKTASLNPARVLGLSGSLGGLQVGKEADLIVIDEDVDVHMTIVGGKVVYRAG